MNHERLTTEDLAGRREYDAPPSTERVENRAAAERDRVDIDRERAEAGRQPTDDQRRAVVADAPHATVGAPKQDAGSRDVQLFEAEQTAGLRRRWSDIQAGFVDEPRQAVELADSLVAETMQQLAQTFASARHGLEQQWDRGDDVTTEDLRLTLQRYRSFFDRLLSV